MNLTPDKDAVLARAIAEEDAGHSANIAGYHRLQELLQEAKLLRRRVFLGLDSGFESANALYRADPLFQYALPAAAIPPFGGRSAGSGGVAEDVRVLFEQARLFWVDCPFRHRIFGADRRASLLCELMLPERFAEANAYEAVVPASPTLLSGRASGEPDIRQRNVSQ